MIMKWWCLFLIKDGTGKHKVEDYFRCVKGLTAAASWKLRLAANHLLSLMPHREIHCAILPFLGAPFEEFETWKSTSLASFESDFQGWLSDASELKETCECPPQPPVADGDSAARRIHDLLDKLPAPGAHILDIIVDEDLFGDLPVKDNVLLYGAMLRAHTWHHASFRPLSSSSNSADFDGWLNHLGVSGLGLQADWIPLWKGTITLGTDTPFGYFELQCSVPPSELTAMHNTRAASGYKHATEESVLWSSSLEVLEEFTFSSLPMHLLMPVPLRLVAMSSSESAAAKFLEHCVANQEVCIVVRLSFWDEAELKTKPSKRTTAEWRHNLQKGGPLRIMSAADCCLQEAASGHLHFILVSNGKIPVLFPLRKTPSPGLEQCLYSGREADSLPVATNDTAHKLLQSIPLVSTSSILESVQRTNTHRLAAIKDFLAQCNSASCDAEELERCLLKLDTDKFDWVTDDTADLSVSPPDETPASLGDPSDWPERRFLVSNSLKGSAGAENCTMAKGGDDLEQKVMSMSATEILKLFDDSGHARRKPTGSVPILGQSTKPSATKEEVERTKWPHLLQCKYHDMYYNLDSEVLESSCCAMRERFLANETATTCSASLSAIPVSKAAAKVSSQARPSVRRSPRKQPVSRGQGAPLRHQQQKRGTRVASAPLRRSPRKAASTQQGLPRKTVPLVQNSPHIALPSPQLRRSPRKSGRKLEFDASKKQVPEPGGGVLSAAEKLRLKLRVAVANALEKNGVTQGSRLYKPCGKKLFAICTTFAQDLVGTGRTSELLQKIADSHAKQVVKFEKLKAGHCKSETTGPG
ncbi:mdm2-binding protein-like [Haemaphysalis longicornis]